MDFDNQVTKTEYQNKLQVDNEFIREFFYGKQSLWKNGKQSSSINEQDWCYTLKDLEYLILKWAFKTGEMLAFF